MHKSWLILAALASPAALCAQAEAPRGVDDPRAFVTQIYHGYERDDPGSISWPTYAYSPRLSALFHDYARFAHAGGALVGTLDFDWWTNSQDWELRDVAVTERATGPNGRIVTARFRNGDRAEMIRFLFVRQHGRWYLDDAVQGSGRGSNGWTLSAVLRDGVARGRAIRR